MAADDKIETPRQGGQASLAVKPADLLSTGSTLVNLACSGHPSGGFPAGYYVYFVGDTDSGKTFLSMTCFAEAVIKQRFKDYRLIYDGGEYGAMMDMTKFFGQAVTDKLEPPAYDEDGNPWPSETIEEFYFNLDDALAAGRPCIYVLDSMDVLSSNYDHKKFTEKKNASRGGKAAKGDYGDGKAGINSRYIRRSLTTLRDTGSILIVINQTRDNPAAGLFESKKTHSGGHALSFYATLKLWSSVAGPIKREVRGKKRVIGNRIRVAVKRSRITGKQRTVTVPIYPTHGIDDTGSCIEFLVDEKHWKKNDGGIITAPEFDHAGRGASLVKVIEEAKDERNLRRLTARVWREIEDACVIEREPRYR